MHLIKGHDLITVKKGRIWQSFVRCLVLVSAIETKHLRMTYSAIINTLYHGLFQRRMTNYIFKQHEGESNYFRPNGECVPSYLSLFEDKSGCAD